MNPNLDVKTYCAEAEIVQGEIGDLLCDVKIEYSLDRGQCYRGSYLVTTRLFPVGGKKEVEVDITHLVSESVIDQILSDAIFS